MEEKKKKFNWVKLGNIAITIVVLAAWLYSYVSMCNDTLTGGKMLCLAIITFGAFCYSLAYAIDPYLTRIEELEEDKLELQAKIEQMKIDSKKKSTKTKKND